MIGMKSRPLTAIVLLNYNGFKDTIECIESILLNVPNELYHIIVVDNASKNDSVEQLKLYIKGLKKDNIHFIQSEKNNGYSSGNNIGVEYARKHTESEYFWILNNDIIVKNDALSPLIYLMESKDSIGIVGSLLLFKEEPEVIQSIGGSFNKYLARSKQLGFKLNKASISNWEPKQVEFVNGASLFVSKRFIQQVGLLCEDYFLYYEEVDWAIRAKKKQFRVFIVPQSIVYHKQGASTNNDAKGKRNLDMMYYQFRNLILFYRKFYPSLTWIAIIAVCLRCIKFAIKQDVAFFRLCLKVYRYHLNLKH